MGTPLMLRSPILVDTTEASSLARRVISVRLLINSSCANLVRFRSAEAVNFERTKESTIRMGRPYREKQVAFITLRGARVSAIVKLPE